MKNKLNIKTKMNSVVNKVANTSKKYSPDILLGVGIVCGIGTVVVACRSTIKAKDILDESKETLELIEKGVTDGQVAEQEYTEEDGRKDSRIVYIQTGAKLVQTYSPALLLGGMSITCVLASHDILRKRNVALSAAYTAVDKSFKDYRKRVSERFGEEVDKDLRYNIYTKKLESIEVDDETGKEKKRKKDVQVADPELESDYACYFDNRSRNYENNSDYNMMFLRAREAYFNDILHIRGHLFLNEVYDALDLPRTAAGQIVGWTADGPDGYVNLRITEVECETENGGHETKFIIDPNVQGDVWSLMK